MLQRMSNGERSKKEGEDDVEEEPRMLRKSEKGLGSTIRGVWGGTPYWRKWMTPVRSWAHGRNAVSKATARLFRREAKGI